MRASERAHIRERVEMARAKKLSTFLNETELTPVRRWVYATIADHRTGLPTASIYERRSAYDYDAIRDALYTLRDARLIHCVNKRWYAV